MRPGVMFGLVQRRDSRYRKMKTTEKVGGAAEVWCEMVSLRQMIP